jgi:hypothetical protein
MNRDFIWSPDKCNLSGVNLLPVPDYLVVKEPVKRRSGVDIIELGSGAYGKC